MQEEDIRLELNSSAKQIVVANGKATTNGNAGMTAVSISGTTITIVTCVEEDCSKAENQKSNTVQVE